MRQIIPILLLALQVGADQTDELVDPRTTIYRTGVALVRGVHEDGRSMRGGVIWCEGEWYPTSSEDKRHGDSHGDYSTDPRFNTDSRGITVFTVRSPAPDMVCHAEGEGMDGTTRFDLEVGDLKTEVIVIR